MLISPLAGGGGIQRQPHFMLRSLFPMKGRSFVVFRELREKTSLTATSGKGLAELQHGKIFMTSMSLTLLQQTPGRIM